MSRLKPRPTNLLFPKTLSTTKLRHQLNFAINKTLHCTKPGLTRNFGLHEPLPYTKSYLCSVHARLKAGATGALAPRPPIFSCGLFVLAGSKGRPHRSDAQHIFDSPKLSFSYCCRVRGGSLHFF